MSSSSPHTPPAGTSGSTSQKPIPHFELPETPRKKGQLQTPSRNVQLKTPSTGKPSKISFNTSGTLLPPSPGALFPPTPGPTPHKQRRKKLNMDALFELSTHMDMGMFLPNHSTVGSGRKVVSPTKVLKAPMGLDFTERSKINENLTFEEDFDESIMASPCKKRTRRRKTTTSLDYDVNTPGGQMITDEKVEQWHGKSYNIAFSSDEEDFGVPLKPMVNPFLDSEPIPTKTRFSRPAVDYSTHNEYINHRTGERKVEELLESQKKFRPKKIDFSGV